MNEFAQKPGESPAAWVDRLGRVSMSGLSDYLLFVLGSWKRDAAEKAAASPVAPAARPVDPIPSVAKTLIGIRRPAPAGGPPLEAAKRAVLALSAEEVLRFTFWFTHGRADG